LQELQVMKVKQSEGSKCYVVTLNSSDNALPQAVLNVTATVSIGWEWTWLWDEYHRRYI